MYILLGIFLIICVYSEKLAYIENDTGYEKKMTFIIFCARQIR